jgi:hypothetical protein
MQLLIIQEITSINNKINSTMTRVLGLGNGLIGTNINLNPVLFVDIA